VIAAASGLVLSSGMAAHAAEAPAERESAPASALDVQAQVGDLGPTQFTNYGKVVGEPQPGDMVVQSGHVGIYIGDGQVISGGMNGANATVKHPLSWLTATGGVTFVRAGA
jgi:cell wall-associated NlpC family hydrolase